MSSTRIESGSAVRGKAMRVPAMARPRVAAIRKPSSGRLDGDDRGLREDRQDLEGEGPVPDHAARPRARPRAARCLGEAHGDGEREREHEVDQQHEGEDRDGLEGRLVQRLRLEGEVGEGDQRDERGHLQELDEEVAPGRDHRDEGLRQDDPAERLGAGHVERGRRLPLAAGDAADGAAHDLGAVGADVEAEREDGDEEGREGQAELRQHEEQPEELHQRRGAAEDLDVGGGEPAQRRRAVEPGEGGEDAGRRPRAAQPSSVISTVSTAPCRAAAGRPRSRGGWRGGRSARARPPASPSRVPESHARASGWGGGRRRPRPGRRLTRRRRARRWSSPAGSPCRSRRARPGRYARACR